MNQSTSELQVDREALLGRIRGWEKELDELAAENGQVVLKAVSNEDRKLVAHFENQFTIQKDRLDKLKHSVKLNGANEYNAKEVDEYAAYFGKLHSEFVAFSESLS